MDMSGPRALRDPAVVRRRLEILDRAQNVRPLETWARQLSERLGVVIPHFDPCEAGVDATTLLVFEAPGPMTTQESGRHGSGFISIDNDDTSASNLWNLRYETGLTTGVVGWNTVPWFLGPASVKPSPEQITSGCTYLMEVLGMLPNLRVIVLSGATAQRSWSRHVAPHFTRDIPVVMTWHPSGLSLKQPGKRQELRAALARAAAYAYAV